MRSNLVGIALFVLVAVGGCAAETPSTPTLTTAPAPAAAPSAAAAAAPPAAAPIVVLPYDEAFLGAANNLFAKAELPGDAAAAGGARPLVIDPLVDGMTGDQTVATRTMNAKLSELVRERYPAFAVEPFSAQKVALRPVVLVGTFTPVSLEGKTAGQREAYRICLALVDLQSGKVISKQRAFSTMQGIDATPTTAFRDSPGWTKDPATEAYVKACQATKVGDQIDTVYTDRIIAAALLADAIEAYDAGRYKDALDLYNSALRTTAGEQLRTYNGLYLVNWRLGRKQEAEQAFVRIVDYGLSSKSLALKLLFKPGSTALRTDSPGGTPYDMWMQTVAGETLKSGECLEVRGHTSPTGPEPLNQRLSYLRAEYVKQRLVEDQPALSQRLITVGAGSRENLIGTGRDDATDALDRRVGFGVISCAT